MRKGLRATEELQIKQLVAGGAEREYIYTLFEVYESAIDVFIKTLEAEIDSAKAVEEAKKAEIQAGIDEGVKRALQEQGLIPPDNPDDETLPETTAKVGKKSKK